MARTIPPDRFAQLVAVATNMFIARGYRATQIADVAEALGVAKGTLYGYVESKDALFDASVRYADGLVAVPSPGELPLKTPRPGATVAYIRERIAAEAGDLELLRAVRNRRPSGDAQRELSTVLSDLYRRIVRNRLALKLVDRCAAEYPDLAQAWFGEGRGAQELLLAEFLSSRAKQKRLRAVDNPDVVARTMLEAIAFWAMHRHCCSPRPALADAVAESAVIDLFVHGLCPEPEGSPT